MAVCAVRTPAQEAGELLDAVLAAEARGSSPEDLLLPPLAHELAASLIMLVVNACDSQPLVQVRARMW